MRRASPVLDPKRPLDKDGKRYCLQLAHVLNAMKLQFDIIVASPLKRCMQTASLVGTEMGYEAKILSTPALAPDATSAQFQRLLRECADFENVLLVGHNPNLTGFIGPCSCRPQAPRQDQSSSGAPAQGSLARPDFTRGPATLKRLLEPRTVRALYATSTAKSPSKTSRK